MGCDTPCGLLASLVVIVSATCLVTHSDAGDVLQQSLRGKPDTGTHHAAGFVTQAPTMQQPQWARALGAGRFPATDASKVQLVQPLVAPPAQKGAAAAAGKQPARDPPAFAPAPPPAAAGAAPGAAPAAPAAATEAAGGFLHRLRRFGTRVKPAPGALSQQVPAAAAKQPHHTPQSPPSQAAAAPQQQQQQQQQPGAAVTRAAAPAGSSVHQGGQAATASLMATAPNAAAPVQRALAVKPGVAAAAQAAAAGTAGSIPQQPQQPQQQQPPQPQQQQAAFKSKQHASTTSYRRLPQALHQQQQQQLRPDSWSGGPARVRDSRDTDDSSDDLGWLPASDKRAGGARPHLHPPRQHEEGSPYAWQRPSTAGVYSAASEDPRQVPAAAAGARRSIPFTGSGGQGMYGPAPTRPYAYGPGPGWVYVANTYPADYSGDDDEEVEFEYDPREEWQQLQPQHGPPLPLKHRPQQEPQQVHLQQLQQRPWQQPLLQQEQQEQQQLPMQQPHLQQRPWNQPSLQQEPPQQAGPEQQQQQQPDETELLQQQPPPSFGAPLDVMLDDYEAGPMGDLPAVNPLTAGANPLVGQGNPLVGSNPLAGQLPQPQKQQQPGKPLLSRPGAAGGSSSGPGLPGGLGDAQPGGFAGGFDAGSMMPNPLLSTHMAPGQQQPPKRRAGQHKPHTDAKALPGADKLPTAGKVAGYDYGYGYDGYNYGYGRYDGYDDGYGYGYNSYGYGGYGYGGGHGGLVGAFTNYLMTKLPGEIHCGVCCPGTNNTVEVEEDLTLISDPGGGGGTPGPGDKAAEATAIAACPKTDFLSANYSNVCKKDNTTNYQIGGSCKLTCTVPADYLTVTPIETGWTGGCSDFDNAQTKCSFIAVNPPNDADPMSPAAEPAYNGSCKITAVAQCCKQLCKHKMHHHRSSYGYGYGHPQYGGGGYNQYGSYNQYKSKKDDKKKQVSAPAKKKVQHRKAYLGPADSA